MDWHIRCYVLAVIAPRYGGYDYRIAYRGDVLSGTYNHTYFPYPATWFIYPFALLPENLGYLLWNIVNALCFLLALQRWNGNYLSFSLFIGTFWTFYAGQIEGFMAGGLVLIMSTNLWVASLGITLLSFKPQIGLFPIIYILLMRKNWRLLVIPTIIYLVSFLQWGWWIPEWLSALHRIRNISSTSIIMVSIFPYSLLLVPLLWRYKSLKIWLYIQSLIMPYYPIYSLTPLFTVTSIPLGINLIVWLFYTSLYKNLTLVKFGFIFPLVLLTYEIWKIEGTSKSKTTSVN